MMNKMTLKTLAFTSILAGYSICAFSAQAQNAAESGIASPGRVQEQLDTRSFEPRILQDVEIRELKLEEAPEGAENVKFELKRIEFEGNSVYEMAELEAVYAKHLGTTISLADLYTIAADITRKYRNDGYILTQVIVPPQTIESGVARLRVVEGFVKNISITGQEEGEEALARIRSYTDKLAGKDVLAAGDLERAMLLINDLPGVKARGVLSPSADTVGASNLAIFIERKRYDGTASIDNYGSRFLGPVQAGVSMGINSAFGYNERITGQIFMTPDGYAGRELMFFSAGYEQPISDNGTLFSAVFSHTSTTPGYILEEFDVQGWATGVTAEISHPFIRSRSTNLTGRISLDVREVTTKNNINIDPNREDHIRTLRAGGQWEYIDNLFGLAFNSADIEVSHGLAIWGSNRNGQENKSRPASDPTFTKIEATLERLQRVTNGVNIYAAAHGQLASAPLSSYEEFGVGGSNFGRGYDASEVIGDDGLAGKLELQWNRDAAHQFIDDYQLYGFYDVGRVWDQDATSSDLKVETLRSTGLGVRANFLHDIAGDAMMALPLSATPQTQDDRGARFYFSLSKKF